MFLITSVLALAFPASAELMQTCHFKGRMILTAPTEIECWTDDLKIESDSEIITNGNKLLVYSDRNMDLANLKIRSFEDSAADKTGRDAGEVTIEANTLTGKLSVNNDAHVNGSGGEIVLKVQGFKDFQRPSFSVNAAGEGRPGGVFIYTAKGRVSLSDLEKNTVTSVQ